MNDFQRIKHTDEQLQLVARGYSMRQLYWPSYTWKIQTQYLNKIEVKKQILEDKGINIDIFSKRKADLFNKINASFYHLSRLKENESAIISLGKEMAEQSKGHMEQGILGIIGTPYEPIDYEYEALLVTLKSSLDILARILSEPSGIPTDNIVSLLNNAQQCKKSNEFLTNVRTLLSKTEHIKIITEFRDKSGIPSKRNYAVHHGSLPTGTINIQFTATDLGILKTRTMEPNDELTDPRKQQTIEDYATYLFYATCDLIIEGLELLLDQKLPRGNKVCVYEERQSKQTR